MTTTFPFSIPETMEAEVIAKVFKEISPFDEVDFFGRGREPMILGMLDSWHVHMEGMVKSLDFLIHQASAVPGSPAEHEHEEAIDANFSALKDQLAHLSGLIEWTRQTWEYDPAVRALAELDKTIEILSVEGDES
jgi:hypothetical protein